MKTIGSETIGYRIKNIEHRRKSYKNIRDTYKSYENNTNS